jgi:putative SOS response-associated peptidase YedK
MSLRRSVADVCGRYAASKDASALVEEFEVTAPVEEELPPDYNVAPTKPTYVVVSAKAERALHVARWGLVPSWAKDPSIGSKMANARVETVAEKPSFRTSLAKRRCLMPATGYYEWYLPEVGEGSARPKKQPFFIHPGDNSSVAMAGLYSWWRDPAVGDDAPWLLTCTVITTKASDALGHIHDRMPMTVAKEHWARWLDPEQGIDPLELLHPAMNDGLVATPVSTLVNNVRNNGPELLRPLATA